MAQRRWSDDLDFDALAPDEAAVARTLLAAASGPADAVRACPEAQHPLLRALGLPVPLPPAPAPRVSTEALASRRLRTPGDAMLWLFDAGLEDLAGRAVADLGLWGRNAWRSIPTALAGRGSEEIRRALLAIRARRQEALEAEHTAEAWRGVPPPSRPSSGRGPWSAPPVERPRSPPPPGGRRCTSSRTPRPCAWAPSGSRWTARRSRGPRRAGPRRTRWSTSSPPRSTPPCAPSSWRSLPCRRGIEPSRRSPPRWRARACPSPRTSARSAGSSTSTPARPARCCAARRSAAEGSSPARSTGSRWRGCPSRTRPRRTRTASAGSTRWSGTPACSSSTPTSPRARRCGSAPGRSPCGWRGSTGGSGCRSRWAAARWGPRPGASSPRGGARSSSAERCGCSSPGSRRARSRRCSPSAAGSWSRPRATRRSPRSSPSWPRSCRSTPTRSAEAGVPPGARGSGLAGGIEVRALRDLREAGHRALVFSSFTSHLALVRAALEAEGFAVRNLDGAMPARQRLVEVDAFQSGEGDVFLISLKAGGVGLNLTAATYVLHLDPWWNPAAEDQATDRAHRIGQTRPVTVLRFVTADTVEAQIVAMQSTKRELADALLEASGDARPVTADQLLALLAEANDAPPAAPARPAAPLAEVPAVDPAPPPDQRSGRRSRASAPVAPAPPEPAPPEPAPPPAATRAELLAALDVGLSGLRQAATRRSYRRALENLLAWVPAPDPLPLAGLAPARDAYLAAVARGEVPGRSDLVYLRPALGRALAVFAGR